MGEAEKESKETEKAETEEKTKRRRKSKNCIKKCHLLSSSLATNERQTIQNPATELAINNFLKLN